MRTDTAEKIIKYIGEKQEVRPKELADYLGIGYPALFRQLKKLQLQGLISKKGTSPRVYYIPGEISPSLPKADVSAGIVKYINQNFLTITPSGQKLVGLIGFDDWCKRHNLPLNKTAEEYYKTRQKYDRYLQKGLINGMHKLKNTFYRVYLDKLYYLDFYSIERFGKTKLGSLLIHAKQSQNRQLIGEIFEIIKPKITQLIRQESIDAIGFIPPTLPRVIQFQKEIERLFHTSLPKIEIVKVTNDIPVAQKTLSKLSDRVENASTTIIVPASTTYKNILLIDDALGSGATLNETARKIKDRGRVTNNIIGLAITGSFKGFEVLNEA